MCEAEPSLKTFCKDMKSMIGTGGWPVLRNSVVVRRDLKEMENVRKCRFCLFKHFTSVEGLCPCVLYMVRISLVAARLKIIQMPYF